MEVKIGVQHSPRELLVDSPLTSEEVEALVAAALASDGVLTLTDDHGRKVLVPIERVSYIEIDRPEKGRVGFSS